MLFNPLTKKLYSDNGRFIKKLFCPYNKNWQDMEGEEGNTRLCQECDHLVIGTANASDKELLEIISKDAHVCFKIDLDQENLKVITWDIK